MLKIMKNIFNIVILVLGILMLIYGIMFEINSNQKIKRYHKVDAYIYKTVNNKDNTQTLYIRYQVKGITYEKIILLEKEKNNTSHIVISYDELDPTNILTEEKDYTGKFLIISGVIIILCSIILFIKV